MMYAYSASTKRSVVVAVAALAGVMSGQRAQAQPGWVLSHQKISDTEGGFTGRLGNLDNFGWSERSNRWIHGERDRSRLNRAALNGNMAIEGSVNEESRLSTPMSATKRSESTLRSTTRVSSRRATFRGIRALRCCTRSHCNGVLRASLRQTCHHPHRTWRRFA